MSKKRKRVPKPLPVACKDLSSDTVSAKPCACKSEFQDSLYGAGMRLHNRRKSGQTGGEWRCTVCGTTK